MSTKLHINISQGLIEIEGDPELVREIYADFKEKLLSGAKLAAPSPRPPAPEFSQSENNPGRADSVTKPKAKRRATVKKKSNNEEGASNGVIADSPKLDKNLDTSSLSAFYTPFSTKNNSDKILIFIKFMTDSLGIESPNTDQVYTCFKATGEKIPKAFAQAFYDTSSKHGYIDFRSSTDFPITIAGDNHFTHTLKRKAAE